MNVNVLFFYCFILRFSAPIEDNFLNFIVQATITIKIFNSIRKEHKSRKKKHYYILNTCSAREHFRKRHSARERKAVQSHKWYVLVWSLLSTVNSCSLRCSRAVVGGWVVGITGLLALFAPYTTILAQWTILPSWFLFNLKLQ